MEKKELELLIDEELVKLAQAGDYLAEEQLLRKFMPFVKARAKLYFITGADDEDTVQEGMIGLVKAIASFDSTKEASFKTFAELCVNRQILSAIKTANRKKHSVLNESLSLSSPIGDGAVLGDAIDVVDSDDPESLVVVQDIVKRMGEIEKELLSGMEYEVWQEFKKGHGLNKIAEDLGKSPKSVDNALQRAKNKIRKYLIN